MGHLLELLCALQPTGGIPMRNPLIPLFFIGILVVTVIVLGLRSVGHSAAKPGDKAAGVPASAAQTTVAGGGDVAANTPDVPAQAPVIEPTATLWPVPPRLQAQVS